MNNQTGTDDRIESSRGRVEILQSDRRLVQKVVLVANQTKKKRRKVPWTFWFVSRYRLYAFKNILVCQL